MLTDEANEELARSVPTDAPVMGPRHALALATRVRARRLEQGWSQDEMAHRAGVARSTYLRFERTGALPSAELCAVLHALGYRDALLALAAGTDGDTAKERRRGRTSLGARVPRARRVARTDTARTTKDNSSSRKDNLMPPAGHSVDTPATAGGTAAGHVVATGPWWSGLDPALEATYRGAFGMFLDGVVVRVINTTNGIAEGRALATEMIKESGLPDREPVFEMIVAKDLAGYARADAGPRRVTPARFAEWKARWRGGGAGAVES